MLDLHLDAMMKQVRASGMPDLCDLPPEAARQLYRQIISAADRPPAQVDVQARVLLPTGTTPELPLRVYAPWSGKPKGLVVYFHGGGYVVGDIAAYDNICGQLCEDSGCTVVTVDYRLAPEHPFPAAVDDAWAALVWAREHARELGADPNLIAVAGDSAGAVLASVCAIKARDESGPRIAFQALLYPAAAGGHGEYESLGKHADGPTLTRRTMEYFCRHYWGETGRAPDWRGAPLLATDLSKLPPALLMLAAHDPLRDEGLAFGEALIAAGTPCTIVEYHGLAHGFISMAGAIGAARIAQAQFGRAIGDALAR